MNARGKYRLRLLALMMLPASRGAEEKMLAYLKALEPAELEKLRGFVDWVEEYEKHE